MTDENWFTLLEALETFDVPGSVDENGQLRNVEAVRPLYGLARGLRASSVLEIGVEYGYSLLTWAYAMRNRPLPSITGIELNPEYPPEKVVRMIRDLGVDLEIVHGDSLTARPSESDFDILFIDGAKDRTLQDFENFLPYVVEGGYVIIDDWPCFMHVADAREVLERRGFHFQSFPYGREFGEYGGNARLFWKKEGHLERSLEKALPEFRKDKRAGVATGNSQFALMR